MVTPAYSRWKNLQDEDLNADNVYKVLGAVGDEVWSAAACLDTVVQDTHVQKALLIHGISRTDAAVTRCQTLAHVYAKAEPSTIDAIVDHFQQTPSDAQLCQLRSVLLERLGRLNTYVELEKAAMSAAVEEEGEAGVGEVDEWEDDPWGEERPATLPTGKLPFGLSEFLTYSFLHSARRLASGQYFDALAILLQRHGSDLWPHRLDILSFIPEHATPLAYRLLLPSFDSVTNCEARWPANHLQADPDFSLSPEVQRAFQQSSHFLSIPSSSSPPSGRPQPLTASQLNEWYISRVNDIIEMTGMIDVALAFVQHGASQGISDLDELGEDLSLLSRLVYDAPQNSALPNDWNLDLWRSMTPEDVVQGYLAHSTPETIPSDISRLVLPYLFVLESRTERAGRPDLGLQERILQDYILSAPLALAASIFEASKPTLPSAQRLVHNDVDVARLALACLYGSDSLAEWPTMSRIFECMPVWETSEEGETDEEAADTTLTSLGAFVTPTTTQPKRTPSDLLLFFKPLPLPSLSRALDILDIHLESGEILSRWSVPAPLRWFLQSADDMKEQKAWATRMARRAGGTMDPLKGLEDWEWLLDDMLKLMEKSETGLRGAFGLLSRKEIITIFMSGLLSTGKFDIAKTLLQQRPHGKISLSAEEVEDICLKCSSELYDNAGSGNYKVGDMKLAYECLEVPPPSPRIMQEKEFIEATSRICSFNVSSRPGIPISPIEIRLTKDRLSLISRVLSSNGDAYKHTEVMLDICYKLGFRDDTAAEVKVLAMMADTALQVEDFDRAYDHSQRMVNIIHTLKSTLSNDTRFQEAVEVCWIACFQLGRQPEYNDLGKKMALLGYSLELCPADKMHDVLTAWRKLQREDIEQREGRLTSPDSAIPQSARPTDRNSEFVRHTVASSLRARLQDIHMPSPPLLSTPDAAALASRTFKSVASNFPFSIGHRPQPQEARAAAAASEGSRRDTHDVSAQASKAISRGIGWLIGVDD